MQWYKFLLAAVAVKTAAAGIGFTSFFEIIEGRDNSGSTAYHTLDRSTSIQLNIQIVAGGDHSAIINDFKTLARNYGSHGVSVIPRVRYGNADGSIAAEPTDRNVILNDVSAWATAFREASSLIQIPVIQAGFLGLWGEWHDGPFCQAQGTDDTPTNREVKKQVVVGLQASGRKVAVRTPKDHQALFPSDRSVTIHNDCMMAQGPNGSDGGTFPENDRATWVAYTKQVAASNVYGGEPCDLGGTNAYPWTNYDTVCSSGSNGLIAYINDFQISYLNPLNPPALAALFRDSSRATCVNAIQAALLKWP